MYRGTGASIQIARKLAFSRQKTFTRVIIRIALVSVTLSVSVMIITSTLIQGFKKEISHKIFDFWGHLYITHAGTSNTNEPLPVSLNQRFYPALDTLGRIPFTQAWTWSGGDRVLWSKQQMTRGGIRRIQQAATLPSILSTGQEFDGIILKGIASDFDSTRILPYIRKGKLFSLAEDPVSDGILISEQTAKRLHLDVGNKVILNFIRENTQRQRRFVVSGIYRTGMEEYDKSFAMIHLGKIRQLLNWPDTVTGGFEVVLDDVRDLDAFAEHLYYEVIGNELYCETARERDPAIFEWMDLQNINETILMVLMVIVALLNMSTTVLILILERTHMIGLLKAVGYRNRPIQQVFLYYALFLALGGVGLGNALGLGLSWLQQQFGFIKLSEENYYLDTAPISFDLSSILWINGLTILVIFLFLWIPTLLVNRVSAIRTLQFR